MADSDVWTIERHVPGGDGFCRLSDGRAGFASGTAVGDRIEVLHREERRGFVRARRWRLLEAGSERVAPPCPIAERCGGCDWMHVSRPAQLRHKVTLLEEALRRTGRFFALPPIDIVSAGSATGYRTRIRLHIDRQGTTGFFARGSHQIVAVQDCAVCLPEVNHAIRLLTEFGKRHARLLALFEQAEIKSAPRGPRLVLRLTPRHRLPNHRELDVVHAELGPDFALDVVGTNLKPGEPQRWPLPENVELFAPSGCFTQVNWAVNTKLVETVVGEALRRGARRFCDAFSGAGNFSLPLAARGLQGLGIDESQAAIAAAREAARASGLSTVEFIAEDVTSALRRLLKEGSRFDLLIIDPPRAGARAIIESIAELRPAQLAVCSCDPVTLSRDLRVLVEGGFFLDQITAFDMFPHTHHLEALAWLHATRRNDP